MDRFEDLNATRASVAGEGWTEPNLYFCPLDKNEIKSG